MLFKYRKSCEKIAMGLLSFMPGRRKLKTLQQVVQVYEEKPEWQLFLWREGEDVVGLLGAEVAEDHFTVRHLSVDPSRRGEGIGHAMVEETKQRMDNREMETTVETQEFLEKLSKPKPTSAVRY